MSKVKNFMQTRRDSVISFGIVIVAYAILQNMLAAGQISHSLSGMLVPICAYIVMAISLNLTVGILGELSLGHAGFMSVGAFTGIVVSTVLAESVPSPALRLVIAMVAAAVFAGAAGAVIGVPVLRLRGDYLAIVTLAFGEIIRNIMNVLYVGVDGQGLHFGLVKPGFELQEGGRMIINGPIGVSGIERISSFTAGFLLILFTLFIVLNLINSRHGRAVMAVRDNRIAADSVGVSTTRYKLMIFVISAAFAGMAGTLYAMNYSTVMASKFDINLSVLVLVFVVLGGLGNIWGSIVAATLLTILPEFLRAINLNDYRMLIYSILLIAVMLFNNSGFKKRLLDQRQLRRAARMQKNAAGSGEVA